MTRTWMAAAALALVGCGADAPSASAPAGKRVESITLTSPDVSSGREIAVDFSCDGANRSPALTWSTPPAGTKSFVVVLEDRDASGQATHWVAFDVNGDTGSLPQGADLATVGGKAGMNDFSRVQYDGPCPPKRELHQYLFHLYALDTALGLAEGASKGQVFAAMAHHVLGHGALLATFSH